MGEEHLGAELGLSAEDAPNFQSKGAAWRGLMVALREEGRFEQVRESAPPRVQALMDKPPLGISWLPAIAYQYVFRALQGEVSDAQMAVLVHKSMMRGPFKAMKGVVEGMLRLFGASPKAFIERMPKIMTQQLTGVTFEVQELSPQSLVLWIQYEFIEDLPRTSFAYWAGLVEVTYDVCGVKSGTTRVEVDPRGRGARVHCNW